MYKPEHQHDQDRTKTGLKQDKNRTKIGQGEDNNRTTTGPKSSPIKDKTLKKTVLYWKSIE